MTTRRPDATLTFPDHWVTEPWLLHEVVATIDLPNGQGHAIAAGGVLQDGTNLLGIVYPRGQRIMRAGPATGWAIEEQFTGRPLRAGRDDSLLRAWALLIQSSIHGKKSAEAEVGMPSEEW